MFTERFNTRLSRVRITLEVFESDKESFEIARSQLGRLSKLLREQPSEEDALTAVKLLMRPVGSQEGGRKPCGCRGK